MGAERERVVVGGPCYWHAVRTARWSGRVAAGVEGTSGTGSDRGQGAGGGLPPKVGRRDASHSGVRDDTGPQRRAAGGGHEGQEGGPDRRRQAGGPVGAEGREAGPQGGGRVRQGREGGDPVQSERRGEQGRGHVQG